MFSSRHRLHAPRSTLHGTSASSCSRKTELPHGRHYRTLCRRYCRGVWRKVVVSVLVVLALAVVWVWPAFSEPPHRTADCRERHWGYDALGRRWDCGDHWLIRIGDYGVLGV